jgi:uncharacterized damage-inducible protein DinB
MRSASKSVLLVCAIFLASGFVLAQDQAAKPARPVGTVSSEMIRSWNDINSRVIAMAEDFPEDKYDFKVQKDQRTFAQNILHIAGTNYAIMSSIAGKKMGPDVKDMENPPRDTYKTKADVVAFIKKSAEEGTALLKSQGDAGLNAAVKSPFGNAMVHASNLWLSAIEHSGEHYGQLVVYYRANNMVPPDSRPQPK